MSVTRTVVQKRSNSKPEDHEGSNLGEILNTNKTREKLIKKPKKQLQRMLVTNQQVEDQERQHSSMELLPGITCSKKSQLNCLAQFS